MSVALLFAFSVVGLMGYILGLWSTAEDDVSWLGYLFGAVCALCAFGSAVVLILRGAGVIVP